LINVELGLNRLAALANACAVNQNVYMVEMAENGHCGRGECIWLQQVEWNDEMPLWMRASVLDAAKYVFTAGAKGERCAVLCEQASQRFAESGRSAGQPNDFAVDGEAFHYELDVD
jgi:hypothetical protein